MKKHITAVILVGAVFAFSGCGVGNAEVQANTPLTQPGNDVFGTMQEAINSLLASPDTNWQHVDTEALRQHLLDMKHFTENVTIISQTEIEKGALIRIKATAEALPSLERALAAHPQQLKSESGWSMLVEQTADEFTLTVTTDVPQDITKIRGLGYIGLMAYGQHHQRHHWMMVQGMSAH